MDLSFHREAFSGWAPLFPLPDTVLLPGALLPLHVFEPRYREMTKDALEGEKLIAMALLRPGFESQYMGTPEVHEWVGLGRIVAHAPLADGRSNLVLAGLRRARIVEEDRSRAYRRGKLEVPFEDEEELPETEQSALRTQVVKALDGLPEALVRDAVRLSVARRIAVPLGAFVDLAADALALGTDEKQVLLSEPRVPDRARKLASLVERRASELSGKSTSRSWPPRFSKN